MEQQKEKTGPKGPRNKVKQVILIEGHPDSVFYDKEVEVCSIKLYRRYLRLGSLGADKIKELRELLGERVILGTRTKRCTRRIPGVVSIKTTKTSTSLTIGAVDQKALGKRVMETIRLLGAPVQERCKWVCEIDKGKDAQQADEIKKSSTAAQENTIESQTAPQMEPTEKVPSTHTKGMSERTLQLRKIALKAIEEVEQEGGLCKRQR